MIRYIKSLTLKQRANGIFGLMFVLYCFVFVGQFFFDDKSWYQPLYWAVQSALIGSVADWFAVTALFRKPLGFPYHTALIPRNKERLINAGGNEDANARSLPSAIRQGTIRTFI